ncbi:MAG: phosphatase PAP2 family protein [Thermoleophilaceae bacterium]
MSGARRLALAAAAAGALAPLVRRRLRLPRPVTSVLVWQAPLAVSLAVPRTRARDVAVYALQMWAYLAHYELPNDTPDELAARVRVGYPIRVDRVIGCGEIPTVRLQRALGGRAAEGVRLHDTALAVVHWSWFFFPHGSVAYILFRHRDHFERSAVQMAAVFDLGAAVYWLVPTAPPWWAAQKGRLPHVRRIMTEAGELFWGRAWPPLYDSLSGNQLAAMPSLHFGTSVMAAHVLSDVGRVPGALGWTYAMTLGFALVYLGEHYVVDLAAGLALAESVRLAGPPLTPSFRRIKRAIQALEPGGGR